MSTKNYEFYLIAKEELKNISSLTKNTEEYLRILNYATSVIDGLSESATKSDMDFVYSMFNDCFGDYKDVISYISKNNFVELPEPDSAIFSDKLAELHAALAMLTKSNSNNSKKPTQRGEQ
ncbi:MAG: hypothetical protein IJ538_00490 [Clostridia bacterium]|nr:hypothetical protein [Clostridia bacterium]